jgi:hypothetical protein
MNEADEGLSLYLIEVKNHLIEYRQELNTERCAART